MESWQTTITTSDETHIWTRGYDVTSLMARATFTNTFFLLHQERLPTEDERRLVDAILIAVSNDGPGAPSAAAARIVASGNRRSIEAAIAAGILAVGDAHGGAGTECMREIAACLDRVHRESISIQEAAHLAIADALAHDWRIPGLGGRNQSRDPRVDTLFSMARESGLAHDGIAMMEGLETVSPRPATGTRRYSHLNALSDSSEQSLIRCASFEPELISW